MKPYRGLAPFGDSDLDALLFFGRGREREVIVANVLASQVTVLYGPSGVGKSSILRAGVARRLRELEPLASVLVLDRWSTEPHLPDPGGEVFLLLDQLEEYFLYHGDGGPLLEELPERLVRPDVHALLSLRDDSLARLDAFAARVPHVLSNRLRLEHLARTSARAAILGPLERYHDLAAPDEDVAIEPELVEAVLDGVSTGTGRVEAPLLQLVLERIWDEEQERGSRMLRRSTLTELGGPEAIVRDHLQRSLAALGAHDAEVANSTLKFLVSPSRTKIAHSLDDLASFTDEPRREIEHVLDELSEQRIVRTVSADGAGTRYEIFHDVLAEPVIEWRHDFDDRAAAARQRRRHRRLLAVALAALAVALAMAGLAAYALNQRGDARRHAAFAHTQQLAAQTQAAYAHAQQQRAQTQAQRARASALEAQRQAKAARAARAEAQRQAALARAQQQKAQQQSKLAEEQSARAKASALEAKRQAARAAAQRAEAQRQARRAHVGELVAGAAAQLAVDPAQSVRSALSAASLEQSARVEESLRDALHALRAQAVLPGGGGPVVEAAFSPDGRRVALAAGTSIRVYSAATHDLEHVLAAGSAVHAIAVAPDGGSLAAATDGGARIWDISTGALRHELSVGGRALDVAFAGAGALVTAGATVDVWDVSTGELVRALPTGPATQIAVTPDGSLVAVRADGSSVVQVLSISTGEQVASPQLAGDAVDLAVSPDGSLLATAGRRNVYLWSTRTWQLARMLTGATFTIADVAFTSDGRVLSAAADGTARVYDAATGSLIVTLVGQHQQRLTAVAVSPDASLVVTASSDETARLWPAPLGSAPDVLAGHRAEVSGAAFSPDGRTVLTWSADGSARLWDATSPALGALGKQDGAVTAVDTSPDGRLAVSAGADGTARVWSFAHGLVRTLPHGGPVTRALFLDDTHVLTASADGFARIWRTDGDAAPVILAHGAPVRAVAVEPGTGRILTAGDDGVARMWTRAGRLLWASGRGASVVSAAAASGVVATGAADGSIRLLRSGDGRLVRTLLGHRGSVSSLAFDPSGGELASGGADATARLWSVDGSAKPHVLAGHRYGVTSVAFSPDGTLVLTASVDGDARLWSASTGRLVRVLRFHVSTVSRAVFSPDGRWIATAGPADVGLWETATGRLFEHPAGLGGGPLTAIAFVPGGFRLVTGAAGGAVGTYACPLCGRLSALVALAHERLAALG